MDLVGCREPRWVNVEATSYLPCSSSHLELLDVTKILLVSKLAWVGLYQYRICCLCTEEYNVYIKYIYSIFIYIYKIYIQYIFLYIYKISFPCWHINLLLLFTWATASCLLSGVRITELLRSEKTSEIKSRHYSDITSCCWLLRVPFSAKHCITHKIPSDFL